MPFSLTPAPHSKPWWCGKAKVVAVRRRFPPTLDIYTRVHVRSHYVNTGAQMDDQVWGWGDVIAATRETDGGLRRKMQRGEIPNLVTENGRTKATLWDIAIIRLMRHLTDSGSDVGRAYGFAKLAIERAYKGLIKGSTTFNKRTGAEQELIYLSAPRVGKGIGGLRIIAIDPSKPELGKAELLLALSDTRNVIVPVPVLLSEAWYSLPDLPDHVAAWLKATSANLEKLGLA